MDFKEIEKLPSSCGVYIMKSKQGEVLYVGKATDLRKRVASHFKGRGSLRSSLFLDKVSDIDYILCHTEEQALILEASLIKEFQPKYNVALKDDKSYPYVVVTNETYPRIYVGRPKKIEEGMVCFGPFVNAKLLKSALKIIRRIFPYRSCKRFAKKPCLYFHLNLCPAPCKGDVDVFEYKKNVEGVCKIIRGERKELIEEFHKLMEKFSQEAKFEEAAKVRDKLLAIYNLYAGRREFSQLNVLKKILGLKRIPFTIEAIDVSSLTGKEATGSVIVFKDGVPDKSNYRRYRIKEVEGIDDYKMIAEVVRRRYRRLKEERKPLPDLVIIDGGKGHLGVAKKELDKLGLKIPVIGIAKKNEEIWLPGEVEPLIIPKDSAVLHLIQRVRNEAHRFAHSYHHLLRKKKLIKR